MRRGKRRRVTVRVVGSSMVAVLFAVGLACGQSLASDTDGTNASRDDRGRGAAQIDADPIVRPSRARGDSD